MYAKKFEPIAGKCPEIIEYLMASPDIPEQENLRFKIQLSIEEIVENIVQYAYENGAGHVEVSTHRKKDDLVIRFKDAGIPFNPLEKPDPDISLSVIDRPVGGLGIFICKQMMDEVCYEYKDGCNILSIRKKIVSE